ncbi:hypothetical protein ANCDUO_26522, partial [Ancylostoma duodenale]
GFERSTMARRERGVQLVEDVPPEVARTATHRQTVPLRKLPRHHYATLKYIIYHLSEITKNSQVNK